MAVDRDPNAWLAAEYQSATQRERAEWKLLGDPRVAPAERLAAYARWRAAAERTTALSLRMREAQALPQAHPAPSSTPNPQ